MERVSRLAPGLITLGRNNMKTQVWITYSGFAGWVMVVEVVFTTVKIPSETRASMLEYLASIPGSTYDLFPAESHLAQ